MTTEEIILRYTNGESIRQIRKISGYSINKISKVLKENNIKVISNIDRLRKYKIDENYFNKIDNEHKAYTLGLLYADGTNNEKKNIVKISLNEEDKDILIKVKKPITPDKPLRYYTPKKGKIQCSFVIDNSKISKKLSKLGVINNKTFKLKFPSYLEDTLVRHFIRGYFDGDGCISLSYPKNYPNYPKYYISFTSTEEFLYVLQDILLNKLNISKRKFNNRHPKRKNNIRTLQIGGNLQVKKILEYLYKDSNIFLDRKYNKYMELSKYLEKK